jgi:hypothetical protein
VNETIVRAAADGLVAGGFASAGYSYVSLDDWYAVRDASGKIQGDPATFPSGMAALGAYIHAKGLKFGVYSAASQRTCGNYSASQFLEAQDADTFANEWGIDFLKDDSCYYSNGVASRARYVAMRDAINATGRQIFYSMEGQAQWADVGNMYRTGGDIWPKWDACVLRNLYANNAQAALFTPGGGFFLDPDMIQATGTEGGTSLTFEEARSQFVLWAVMKAPLILGAHYALLATMRATLPQYFELLTHPEIIGLNQDISPMATLRLSMPSTQQRAGAVSVTLQACDASRGDQLFEPAPAASPPNASAISSKHGALCLTASNSSSSSSAVLATPCAPAAAAAQGWQLFQDSRFHVALQPATGACLGLDAATGAVAALPCQYTGPLPPPFTLDLGSQLWVWDRKGEEEGEHRQRDVLPLTPSPLAGLTPLHLIIPCPHAHTPRAHTHTHAHIAWQVQSFTAAAASA